MSDERGRRLYRGGRRIDLTIRPDAASLPLPAGRLATAIAAALDAAGAPVGCSIGLVLSNDAELAVLNEAYLGATGPTDVLSFPLLPPGTFPSHPRGSDGAAPDATGAPGRPAPRFVLPPGARIHLGDIVVSVERAIEQAETGRGGWSSDRRWSPAEELRLLVVHGTLHVCGWDHAEPVEEAAMRELERRLLGGAG